MTVLAAALPAQSVVSPPHFTSVEGNAWLGHVASTSSARVLQVHDDLKGVPRTVRSIAFRRDNWSSPQSNGAGEHAAFVILADLWCSTAGVSAASMNPTFDANHGFDKALVASAKQFQFPAAPHHLMPSAFSYALPFDRPFAYTGSAGLCWELVIRGRNNLVGYRLDAVSGASAYPGPVTWQTTGGCRATGEVWPMELTANGSTVNWTTNSGDIVYSGRYLPKSSVVGLGLGLSATSWNSIPLPLPIPGSATAPSGFCQVANDWSVIVPVLTTGSGTCSARFPAVAVSHGMTIFGQLFAIDPAANAFGLVMSGGEELQVIGPWNAPHVGRVDAFGTPSSGTAASYPLASCLVSRFD
ncbi:MAG: hypothetical protein H6832_12150 [Planctomycetes bacterium]|nr:hypothetical protein [Planctomycetota bacterium]